MHTKSEKTLSPLKTNGFGKTKFSKFQQDSISTYKNKNQFGFQRNIVPVFFSRLGDDFQKKQI